MIHSTKNKIKIAIALIAPFAILFAHDIPPIRDQIDAMNAAFSEDRHDQIALFVSMVSLPGIIVLLLLRHAPVKKGTGGFIPRMLARGLFILCYLSMYLPFVLYVYITMNCGDFDLQCLLL